MDISREEQRVLHALAQGGRLVALKAGNGKPVTIECYSRDGWLMPAIRLQLFHRLRNRKAIASTGGGPYRITRRGLELVRSEVDNR